MNGRRLITRFTGRNGGRQDGDTAFVRDLKGMAARAPRWSASLLLFAIVMFAVAAVVWAARAPLDQVTTGIGHVIPSSQVQVIQNLEGGILAQILVHEGDEVARDQVLLRLDDTASGADYGQGRARYLALQATITRLSAEIKGTPIRFAADIVKANPDLVIDETALFKARNQERREILAILKETAVQREQELNELESRLGPLGRSYALAKEELAIIAPMVEKGVTAKVELIRLKRELSELEGKMQSVRLSIEPARTALSMAKRKIREQEENFRGKILGELNKASSELKALEQVLSALKDRMVRTEIRSPVDGTVKRLMVTTIGGVVAPGMPLVEIVPLEDRLLIEARILPSDIAFLHPGLEARIKLTAYDFSIYGSLAARLEHISADTIIDERGQAFYRIRVRTENNHLGPADDPLPIIAGMTAEVDILTGCRTVLEYLLKPFLKARYKALRER